LAPSIFINLEYSLAPSISIVCLFCFISIPRIFYHFFIVLGFHSKL
jgi:hypothetical protein